MRLAAAYRVDGHDDGGLADRIGIGHGHHAGAAAALLAGAAHVLCSVGLMGLMGYGCDAIEGIVRTVWPTTVRRYSLRLICGSGLATVT